VARDHEPEEETVRDIALAVFTIAFAFLAGSPALAADGAALYKANCAKCHGDDGNANTPVGKAMKVPALHAGQVSPEKLVEHVRGSDKHKSVAGKLSDEELTAIANALPAGG
jgi:cytochrome c6